MQGLWEQHILFNWAPPLGDWAQAIVVEANELRQPDSPALTAVEHLREVNLLCEPEVFIAHARAAAASASVLSVQSNHELQIAVHEYLREGRAEPSPDSAHIVSWLPDQLGRVMEIGAGYGALARKFIHRAQAYTALVLTRDQAEALKALGAEAVVGDMHELPFPDGGFDTLVADNVMEHATDPVRALQEVRRVLAPAGRAYFILPLDYLASDYANPSHHWKADEASIRSALAIAGLQPLRVRTAHVSAFGVGVGSNPSCMGMISFWEVAHAAAPVVGAAE
jgi:SAM-dependent methyltransferase